MLPSIECYCDKTTAGNAIVVTVGDLDVYFSYRTPVAFRHPSTGLVCSTNVWSVTTGRHLNAIAPKSERVPFAEFEAKSLAVTGADRGVGVGNAASSL